jgi:hypothetical protein
VKPWGPAFLAALVVSSAAVIGAPVGADPLVVAARDAEPVVLTGQQLPAWSQLPAVAAPTAWPNGANMGERGTGGTIVAPPDARTGVAADRIAAYRWDGTAFVEIPVQIDQRLPALLANPNSDFALYSATDEELIYQWDSESWKKTAGECFAEYPSGVGPTPDPVAVFDDDDEVAFMASDAGEQAPAEASGPPGTDATRQEVSLVDPLDPGARRYVYLFLKPDGSSFDSTNGYVSYERDANADEWIDKFSIARDDPETLGWGNGGYGPNLSGTVCRTALYAGYPTIPDGAPRSSDDRYPRDGVTVRTSSYRWHASGRWMIREMRVTRPGQAGVYGPDLVDRWKGRAFQQSPDSEISLVGFEDEQVNWEANSALLGERAGPVRAIREVWGADSGTNVTKTETFYRDVITYRYHVRVHPVPPDGLYQSWDYNAGVVAKYYNAIKTDGVDIDGMNDDMGNIDDVGGTPAYFDAPDPTFQLPLAIDNWQQVSGKGDSGSLVYLYDAKGPTTALNPLSFLYYRDDKCFDDGTGDDPVARPWPGEPTTDPRVQAAYAGKPCDERQGAWGTHGAHVMLTGDTDNAFQSKPLTELDTQEWQFAVPTSVPHAVGEPYANSVRRPMVSVVTEQSG